MAFTRTAGKHRRPTRAPRTTRSNANLAGIATLAASGVVAGFAAPALAASDDPRGFEDTGLRQAVAMDDQLADQVQAQAESQQSAAEEAAAKAQAEAQARKEAARSVGQTVTPGQQIGLSGATGNVTGPHLHFEARTSPDYGSDIDPVAYLRSHGVNL
ncbi:M23 family metallopeptidase [Streptomyces sp. MCAF7]